MGFLGKQHFAWPRIGRNLSWPLGGGTVWDVDAVSFLSDTYSDIADEAVRSAVNTLVTSLKSAGLWAKIWMLYPFASDGVSVSRVLQHGYNLIDPSKYFLTFSVVPSDHTNKGWTLKDNNTSNAVTPAAGGVWTDWIDGATGVHAILSQHETSVTAVTIQLDVITDIDSTTKRLACRFFSGTMYLDGYNTTSGRVTQAGLDKYGIFGWSREVASTRVSIYRNGVQQTTKTGAGGTIPDGTVLFFPSEKYTAGNTPAIHNFISFGEGLSEAEMGTYNTIVLAYNTELSRNV